MLLSFPTSKDSKRTVKKQRKEMELIAVSPKQFEIIFAFVREAFRQPRSSRLAFWREWRFSAGTRKANIKPQRMNREAETAKESGPPLRARAPERITRATEAHVKIETLPPPRYPPQHPGNGEENRERERRGVGYASHCEEAAWHLIKTPRLSKPALVADTGKRSCGAPKEHEERVLRRAARPAAATSDGRLRLPAARASAPARALPPAANPTPDFVTSHL
ncbi:unnamed protein product, partial [Iphiclides podalirius]